jgi:plastocyanin
MMAPMRKITPMVLAVPCLVLLSGCGQTRPDVYGGQGDPIPKNEVIVIHRSFIPKKVTITAGQTVTWHFDDGAIPENVVFDPPLSSINSGTRYSGTFKVTFPDPGTYTYRGTLHGNMAGTVVVKPAS